MSARIHALLRRPAVLARDESLTYIDLRLDPVTRETRRGDRAFNLTAKEYDLLHYLLRNPRQVLRRGQILQEVWGYDFGGEDNVLEVYIGYLRKKTEAGGEPRLIQTVPRVGYTLPRGRMKRSLSIRLRLTLLYAADPGDHRDRVQQHPVPRTNADHLCRH